MNSVAMILFLGTCFLFGLVVFCFGITLFFGRKNVEENGYDASQFTIIDITPKEP